jgi:nucleotide-binding universal stress UspA family protein
MFSRILVPVDVHEPDVAHEALDAALALAKAFAGELRLVHVAMPILLASPMAAIPQSVYDTVGVFENSELERLAAKIDIASERITTVVRIGGVYPELLAEAAEWGADLIVVGAHRRSMASFLLGSTAAAVSRHAACTVMIVRSAVKARFI